MPTGIDARSEKNIKTLVPGAQDWARAFLQRLLAAGINARIISGTRTYAEQNELYALGRTKPGHIVTKARGGFSNHNFGIAWDIGIFDGNEYIEESSLYDRAGEIGRKMGLEWGGDWKGITDKPHFQIKVNMTLAELRKLHDEGRAIPIPPLSDPDKVRVCLGDADTDIPAFLIADRTWVGVRKFVETFKGELVSAGGTPFTPVVRFKDVERPLEGRIIDKTGYVRFADVNALFELDYIFDSKNRTLKITSK